MTIESERLEVSAEPVPTGPAGARVLPWSGRRDRLFDRGRRFMEEPMEVRTGDSLAGNVSEYVESIMRTAEQDAVAIRDEAERDCERTLEDARAEVDRRLSAANRELANVAAARVARLLELRRAIDSKVALLVDTIDVGDQTRQELAMLIDAFGERADAIAREAAPMHERGEPALAPVDAPPEIRIKAARDDAHLYALRRAVAGATRGELEPEIEEMLSSHDGACAVLDDVFGSTEAPFRKWAAAQDAARPERPPLGA